MYYTHVHPCTTLYTACMPLVYNCERPSYYRGHGSGDGGDAGALHHLGYNAGCPAMVQWCYAVGGSAAAGSGTSAGTHKHR